MARDYGRIWVRIWQDQDFTSLTSKAQQLYFYLSTQAKIDMAGVVPWRPRMAAKAASDLTEKTITQALQELESNTYVLLDEETDELLVRSFIRSDEILKSPNMAKAMVKAWRGIDSTILRGVISFEVHRLSEEHPELKGLQHCESLFEEPLIDPQENPFGKGFGKGSGKGCRTTTTTTTSLTTTTTTTADPKNTQHFDKFWEVFPSERKANKQGCKKKFQDAIKNGVNPNHIIQAAQAYRDDPNREPTYTVNPHKWLNEERWDAGPLPPRNAAPAFMTATERKLAVGAERAQRLKQQAEQPQPYQNSILNIIQGEITQ